MDDRIYRYWGKAKPKTDSGPQWHLLVYHSLDVAAVGYVLLQSNPHYLTAFQRLIGLDKATLIRWSTFLLALHDIGKFADGFQNLNPNVLEKLQNRHSDKGYFKRHDTVGWIIWREHLRQHCHQRGIIQAPQPSRYQVSEPAIDIWLSAMVGHHGEPPNKSSSSESAGFELEQDFTGAAIFVDEMITLLLKESDAFPECDKQLLKRASWWLSGFAVLCDWLGSNTDYFPYEDQEIMLDDYWKRAQKQAQDAIQKTELLSCLPSSKLSLADLIKAPSGLTPEATPLQHCMAHWDVSSTPQLVILEDVTGAGKTEAAVLLAHRLMQTGQANSLYFALPTMATANTMYDRMRDVYRKLFALGSQPSLVLAHGASAMVKDFRQSILPSTEPSSDTYGDGTVPAGTHCNAWLADNRKKALLADIGVGTIDQALLAILRSRHQSLRLLGLLNNILLADEIHACDAWMHELLCALLRAHATTGGSAVLLSATLPQKQRQALVSAYAEGRNRPRPILQAVDDKAYPLVTSLTDSGLQETIVATRSSVKRKVKIQFLAASASVEQLIAETVANDQCICWIRNTVKDAVQSYCDLKKDHPDWTIDLFHARFALEDRLTIETRVVKRFGKNSTARERRGQVLISTQVFQESLDACQDYMITDLAPIDLIIQRAGRLRRHSRDASGNPIDGADQRGDVVLHIYSPPFTDSPSSAWYADFFPNAKKVYDHHGQLWLTAKLLHQKGQFRMPEDARILIESVYGDAAQEDIPKALRQRSNESIGKSSAEASLARWSVIKLELGYDEESERGWQDEAKAMTRLGEETVQVYLARWQDGILRHWSDDKEHPWPLSVVSMRSYWICAEATTAEITQQHIDDCKAQMPAKGKWGVLLPLIPASSDEFSDNSWQGWAMRKVNDQLERIRFFYNDRLGLRVDERQG